MFVGFPLGKITLDIEQAGSETLPDSFINLLSILMLADGCAHLFAKLVIAYLLARNADNSRPRRNQALLRQAIECRYKFAFGEVPGCAKDYDSTGRRRVLDAHPGAQWVVSCNLRH